MTDRDKDSLYNEWKKRQQREDQLRQEVSARESVREREEQQAKIQAEALEQELKRRGVLRGQETIRELDQEIQQQQLDRLAERIKNNVWGNEQGVAINLTKVTDPDVKIYPNGTIRNRSLVGMKLSYSYEDVAHWSYTEYIPNDEGAGIENVNARSGVKIVTQEFSFGIGYFGQYGKTMGDENYFSKPFPTNETALEKGMKSYYIRTRIFEPIKLDENNPVTTAYPCERDGIKQVFIDRLYDRITPLSPNIVVPQARERVREWNATHKPPPAQQPQQGFFRRLFRKG